MFLWIVVLLFLFTVLGQKNKLIKVDKFKEDTSNVSESVETNKVLNSESKLDRRMKSLENKIVSLENSVATLRMDLEVTKITLKAAFETEHENLLPLINSNKTEIASVKNVLYDTVYSTESNVHSLFYRIKKLDTDVKDCVDLINRFKDCSCESPAAIEVPSDYQTLQINTKILIGFDS